jgi:hypothetical protein
MILLSALLVILALPLLLTPLITGRKNPAWLRLGGVLIAAGILLLVAERFFWGI